VPDDARGPLVQSRGTNSTGTKNSNVGPSSGKGGGGLYELARG